MYLRHIQRKKNGKEHSYWSIVESSALADLLGVDVGAADPHKLYGCHDQILAHKSALFSHLVGTPKGRLTKLEKDLVAKPWQQARPGVTVKLLPQERELYVLARSADRVAYLRELPGVLPARDAGPVAADPGTGIDHAECSGEVRGGSEGRCAYPHQRRSHADPVTLHPAGAGPATAVDAAEVGTAGPTAAPDHGCLGWKGGAHVVKTFGRKGRS